MKQETSLAERLARQIAFVKEIDKVKAIFRQTRLIDNSRYENDAEHSWHLAVMAIFLAEYANDPALDVAKVIKMVLIHDIVEIDVGDTYVYDVEARAAKKQLERAASQRLFGLLPADQGAEALALWEEFEARATNEAKFAAALDRLQPLIHNAATEGYAWKQHGIRRHQVEAANRHIAEGSHALWAFVERLIADSVARGFLAE